MKYQKEHYADVASILLEFILLSHVSPMTRDLVNSFAYLFAADNPPICIDCGCRQGSSDRDPECSSHLFADGFDRERFLKACGLES